MDKFSLLDCRSSKNK